MKTQFLKFEKLSIVFGLFLLISSNAKSQVGCSSFTGNTMPVLSTSNTAGGVNCMLGLRTATPSGQNNTAYGVHALSSLTSNHNNSAFGLFAAKVTTGGDNAAFGCAALSNNTSGSNITAIGVLAGNTNGTGSNNTYLGRGADGSANNWSNSMALGYNTIVNASNKLRVCDANVTVCEAPVAWTSDGRFKFNLSEDDVKGLDFIMRLRPVVYNFDSKKFTEFLTQNMSEETKKQYFKDDFSASTARRQSGFIAQEVEKAAVDAGYDFSGVHKPKTEFDNYSLGYAHFVVPMVKAMQQQQKMIEDLQARLQKAEKASGATGITENDIISSFAMSQNEPNPFTHETIIKYSGLSSDVKDAHMTVFDMSGKQVAKFDLDRNANSITITSEKLAAGMYIYAIIADGRSLDSKRMIVADK